MTIIAPASRNAARSREQILDAAESVFAQKGYEATSLQEVGLKAGLSRGAPGYFFGSKADLYQTVLERSSAEALDAVRTGRARALASGEPAERVLTGTVADYFDFFAARPNFVRLIEWEALSDERYLASSPPHIRVAQEALAAMSAELGLGPAQSDEARQLLLSIISLCWFPLAHGNTVLRALGIDPTDPAFLERRKHHVVSLVLHGVRSGEAGVRSAP